MLFGGKDKKNSQKLVCGSMLIIGYSRYRGKKPLLKYVAVIVGFRACVRWRSGSASHHTRYIKR